MLPTAQVGTHDLTEHNDSCVGAHAVQHVVIHPKYNKNLQSHDLCLLQLQSPAPYPPIPSLQATEVEAGLTATVAGWGKLSSDGPQPSVPHHVRVPIVDRVSEEEGGGWRACSIRPDKPYEKPSSIN